MKLSDAVEMSIDESRIFCEDMVILESGEGPRWRFRYSNFKNDPTPDILLLGSYQHPRTRNNLVGGINLHYLSKEQIENLSKVLPQIMAARNLYGRYHTGKRLIPDVFEHSYRTYNAAYIHGVKQDVTYPKYGFMKTAADWIKKKIGGIFKSKAQRQKEAEPQFPDDLSGMRDRLDQVVQQLQQRPPEGVPQDTPEMQAARDAFLQFRREQAAQEIERQEDIPLQRASQDYAERQSPPIEPEPEIQPEPEIPQQTQPQTQAPPQPDPRFAQAQMDQEREKHRQELLDPNNDVNLEEAIIYYSPLRGKYVVEPAYNIVHSDW